MNTLSKLVGGLLFALFLMSLAVPPVVAQSTGGTLRGTITDPQGLPIGQVSVHLLNNQTQAVITVTTEASGIYNYPDLPVGTYTITAEKEGFQKSVQNGVQVFSNQITQVNIPLQVGAVSATVEVTATAPLVQTGTSQLSNDFDTKQVTELPNTELAGSPLNLALLAPGTTPQGAGVLGEGGSIGGTRPRMNSFTIDGVDDNRLDVTGHTQNVIQDSIAEFNLLTNQFSAEYGHSAGGQFNIITKTGTNSWHGDAWGYNQNRNYNAMDNLQKVAALTQPSRFDYTRAGADMGGPIIHNKLFVYGAYQRIIDGLATQAVVQDAPTAAGLATLQSFADPAVKNILAQFPLAPSASTSLAQTIKVPGTTCGPPANLAGCQVAFGEISPIAPNFFNEHDFIVNGDITLARHQISFHAMYDHITQPLINNDTPQPQFSGSEPTDARKYLFKDTWILNNRTVNDFRASLSRFALSLSVPTAFANFPNAEIDDVGLNIGPNGCAPQSNIINTYQIEDNVSYVAGNHNLKWGAQWLHWIAPNDFLPRSRGEWDYANINELVNDYVPTGLNGTKRGAGSGAFAGNQNAIGLFFQDDWKVTQRLTLNLGVRYEWNGVPRDDALQNANSISTLPGTNFIFNTPSSDLNNVGPRLGFAYDPFGNGKWAVRGGFGISYDVTPQNFPEISLPPQLQTEQNPDITCALPGAPAWCADYVGGSKLGKGFLQGGGLLQVNVPCTDQATCRASTGSIILPVVEPKVITWTLGVQHELGWNSSIEVRYVGTRSLELPIQAQLNVQTGFTAGLPVIPTYLSASAVPASVPATAPNVGQWDAFTGNTACTGPSPFIHGAQGFCGNLVTGFPPLGSGIYHGASVDFNHRVGHGLSLRTNYTFSKNIDDATNELFSSRVNPRRSQDWQHIGDDRGLSSLDVTHKFILSWVYDLPGMGSGFERGLTGGWEFSGTYFLSSGTPVTILNGADANGNKDSAGDRPIFNPAGTSLGGSIADPVCNDGAGGATRIILPKTATRPASAPCVGGDAHVVGYVADDPTQKYVVAGLGALSNVGRNTYRSPGINLWSMSVGKTTSLTERFKVQFRVDAFDVFNHRSFALAQPSVFEAGTSGDGSPSVNNALSTTYTNILANGFLNKYQFTGGSRNMQMVLKLMF